MQRHLGHGCVLGSGRRGHQQRVRPLPGWPVRGGVVGTGEKERVQAVEGENAEDVDDVLAGQ
nr:hypothetical protein [Streptomyces montanus]